MTLCPKDSSRDVYVRVTHDLSAMCARATYLITNRATYWAIRWRDDGGSKEAGHIAARIRGRASTRRTMAQNCYISQPLERGFETLSHSSRTFFYPPTIDYIYRFHVSVHATIHAFMRIYSFHANHQKFYQNNSWPSLDVDAAAAAAAAEDDAPGGHGGWPGAAVQSSSWCRGLAS